MQIKMIIKGDSFLLILAHLHMPSADSRQPIRLKGWLRSPDKQTRAAAREGQRCRVLPIPRQITPTRCRRCRSVPISRGYHDVVHISDSVPTLTWTHPQLSRVSELPDLLHKPSVMLVEVLPIVVHFPRGSASQGWGDVLLGRLADRCKVLSSLPARARDQGKYGTRAPEQRKVLQREKKIEEERLFNAIHLCDLANPACLSPSSRIS